MRATLHFLVFCSALLFCSGLGFGQEARQFYFTHNESAQDMKTMTFMTPPLLRKTDLNSETSVTSRVLAGTIRQDCFSCEGALKLDSTAPVPASFSISALEAVM